MGNINLILEKLVSKSKEFDEDAKKLPELFVNILNIHTSLLNLSYIYAND